MIMKSIAKVLFLGCCLTTFSAVTTGADVSNGDTCNVWQVCLDNKDAMPWDPPKFPCTDGSAVTVPIMNDTFVFAPAVMPSLGIAQLKTACPFYEPDDLLCCTSDTAAIMVHNFQQLDGVFKTDCPICAANLKKMWCEYACKPDKTSWNLWKGQSPGVDTPELYTNIQVSIDDAYACTIYQSCMRESFIAAAGVSSSVAFLNFLGYNGAMYSLSYINFTTDLNVTASQLDSDAVPCEYKVTDETLFNYTEITDSSCSFCQKACPPPVVTDKIGFLDGFSWKLVGYSYLGFVIFTILFQVVSHCYLKKRKLEKAERAAIENQTNPVGTSRQSNNNSRYTQQGRPVNVTNSDVSSLDMGRRTNLSQNSQD